MGQRRVPVKANRKEQLTNPKAEGDTSEVDLERQSPSDDNPTFAAAVDARA